MPAVASMLQLCCEPICVGSGMLPAAQHASAVRGRCQHALDAGGASASTVCGKHNGKRAPGSYTVRQAGRQLSVVRIQAAVCDNLLRFWNSVVDCELSRSMCYHPPGTTQPPTST